MGKTEVRDKPPDRVEAVFFQQEAQDPAESPHLLPGDGMTGMGLKPGKRPLHRRMGFEESGNAHGAFILPLDPQVQGFHAAQQQVGGHGVEYRPVNFAIVMDLIDQILGTAGHTSEASA